MIIGIYTELGLLEILYFYLVNHSVLTTNLKLHETAT